MQTAIVVALIVFNVIQVVDTTQTCIMYNRYGWKGECSPLNRGLLRDFGKTGIIAFTAVYTFQINYMVLKNKDEYPHVCFLLVASMDSIGIQVLIKHF